MDALQFNFKDDGSFRLLWITAGRPWREDIALHERIHHALHRDAQVADGLGQKLHARVGVRLRNALQAIKGLFGR